MKWTYQQSKAVEFKNSKFRAKILAFAIVNQIHLIITKTILLVEPVILSFAKLRNDAGIYSNGALFVLSLETALSSARLSVEQVPKVYESIALIYQMRDSLLTFGQQIAHAETIASSIFKEGTGFISRNTALAVSRAKVFVSNYE